MKKNKFVMIAIMFLLTACVSATAKTITVGNKTISEEDIEFTSWSCYAIGDYKQEKVLLNFGYINNTELTGLGFVLYDGGDDGEPTFYQRAGLEHRWDWGDNNGAGLARYSFVIKPDGTGLYYDFTGAKKGESTTAKDVFKCYKNK